MIDSRGLRQRRRVVVAPAVWVGPADVGAVEMDVPPTLAHRMVVPGARQDHVLLRRRAAVGPVDDVVGVAAAGVPRAAGEPAGPVAQFQPTAQGRGGEPGLAAECRDPASRVDGRARSAGVAGEPPRSARRHGRLAEPRVRRPMGVKALSHRSFGVASRAR